MLSSPLFAAEDPNRKLYDAVGRGDLDEATDLLQNRGASPNKIVRQFEGDWGRTSFMRACRLGNVDMITLLSNNGGNADLGIRVFRASIFSYDPSRFHGPLGEGLLAEQNQVQVTEMLLNSGAYIQESEIDALQSIHPNHQAVMQAVQRRTQANRESMAWNLGTATFIGVLFYIVANQNGGNSGSSRL